MIAASASEDFTFYLHYWLKLLQKDSVFHTRLVGLVYLGFEKIKSFFYHAFISLSIQNVFYTFYPGLSHFDIQYFPGFRLMEDSNIFLWRYRKELDTNIMFIFYLMSNSRDEA